MSTVLAEAAYHKELIDGREIEKPLPKKLHARVQAFLMRVLGLKVPRPYEALPELNVLCGNDRLVPDITIVDRSAHYEDGDLADQPAIAIEIMSPGQTFSNMVDKCERLHKAGTPQCWVIWPERRQAWIFTPVSLDTAKEKLTAAIGDSSIEVSLAEMWADLD
jgi:Uma2 family endonuclease